MRDGFFRAGGKGVLAIYDCGEPFSSERRRRTDGQDNSEQGFEGLARGKFDCFGGFDFDGLSGFGIDAFAGLP